MRLGFIGTGRMGHPMARKLVEAGHEVRALTRSQDKRAALAADGAHPVATVPEAGEGADVVLVCVFTDEQVQEVCQASGLLDAMPAGAALVIHTTGSPRTAENIAVRATPFGISVIDAPVSGGPHDIAAGHLTLFAGGTPAALDQARPALASYADPILHVGPLGAGQRVKLVNNALFAAHLGLLASAVDLAAQLGVDESVLLSALPHGSAASRALTAVASRGSVAAFAETVADFLTKDIEVARKTAAQLGATLGLLDQPITAATAAGLVGTSESGIPAGPPLAGVTHEVQGGIRGRKHGPGRGTRRLGDPSHQPDVLLQQRPRVPPDAVQRPAGIGDPGQREARSAAVPDHLGQPSRVDIQ